MILNDILSLLTNFFYITVSFNDSSLVVELLGSLGYDIVDFINLGDGVGVLFIEFGVLSFEFTEDLAKVGVTTFEFSEFLLAFISGFEFDFGACKGSSSFLRLNKRRIRRTFPDPTSLTSAVLYCR